VVELLAFLFSAAWLGGDPAAARSYLKACLASRRGADDRRGIAACMELIAEAGVGRREAGPGLAANSRRAARLLGAAQTIRGPSDASLWWPAERVAWERGIAAAREILGEAAFTAAWREGEAMTVEQALHEASLISLEERERV
jgi:hypothetical protein